MLVQPELLLLPFLAAGEHEHAQMLRGAGTESP